ncbi:MAG: hypothetical protein NUV77_12885 [Thermoguttaceae bacterium]|jgi:hypothetical protein|nr:hypothetical protein [Thermoguttaceae bacterium]
MNMRTVIFGITGFWLAVGGTHGAEPRSMAEVSVAPVLHFRMGTEIVLPIYFENVSAKPLRYLASLTSEEGGGVTNLELYLCQRGELVRPRVCSKPPGAEPEDVRTLNPGERAIQPARISDLYPRLKAGAYELVASYKVPENSGLVTRLGLTPLVFRRTVAYLVIEEEKPKGSDRGHPTKPPPAPK